MEEVYAYAIKLANNWHLWGFGVNAEEVRSIVNLIVSVSLKTYDPEKGNNAKAYVMWAVKRRLFVACYEEGAVIPTMRLVHTSRMVRTGLKRVGTVRSSDRRDTGTEHGEAAYDPGSYHDKPPPGEVLEWAYSQLPVKRWRDILRMRFSEEKTLLQIAKTLGVTAEAVRQVLERNILPALREAAECWY